MGELTCDCHCRRLRRKLVRTDVIGVGRKDTKGLTALFLYKVVEGGLHLDMYCRGIKAIFWELVLYCLKPSVGGLNVDGMLLLSYFLEQILCYQIMKTFGCFRLAKLH